MNSSPPIRQTRPGRPITLLSNRCSHGLDDGIAGGMTMGVVNGLEFVEVAVNDGEMLVPAAP